MDWRKPGTGLSVCGWSTQVFRPTLRGIRAQQKWVWHRLQGWPTTWQSKVIVTRLGSVEANTCVKCNSKEHKIYACSKFDELSIEQNRTFVKAKSLSFNCLMPGHVSRKCEPKFTCKFWHNRHHSLPQADILCSQGTSQALQKMLRSPSSSGYNKGIANSSGVC